MRRDDADSVEDALPTEKKRFRCKRIRPASEFGINIGRHGKKGLGSRCKECNSEYMKNYYKSHKEHWDERRRRIQDEINETKRRRYREDPEYRQAVIDKVKEYRLGNPESVRSRKAIYYYGITLEDSSKILDLQGGGCAICGRKKTQSRSKSLGIDHDHKTGKIRGILCENCNRAIGLLRDSPRIIRKAAAYIEANRDGDPKHPTATTPLFSDLHDEETADHVA